MKHTIKRWFAETEGATAVEYGLLVAAVSIVILVAVFSFSGSVVDMFEELSGWLGG